jgi:hypothetical protein
VVAKVGDTKVTAILGGADRLFDAVEGSRIQVRPIKKISPSRKPREDYE